MRLRTRLYSHSLEIICIAMLAFLIVMIASGNAHASTYTSPSSTYTSPTSTYTSPTSTETSPTSTATSPTTSPTIGQHTTTPTATSTATGGIPVISNTTSSNTSDKPFKSSHVAAKSLPRTGGFYSFGLIVALICLVLGAGLTTLRKRESARSH